MLIVSLTTIPPRFNNIFKHLYIFYTDQTVKPDKIILNICHTYKRFSSTINIDIMDPYLLKLKELDIIHINYTDDYGALTKLYPTIKYINEHYKDQEIDIITIDDDCEYINNLIEILMKYAIQFNKTSLIGFFGFNLDASNEIGDGFHPSIENHCKSIDVLGGVNGLYYNYKFFKEFTVYDKYIKSLTFDDYLCDDEVSNMFMRYKNINRIMINEHTFKKIDPSAYAEYALHKNNVRERQNKTLHNCIKLSETL